MVSKYPRKSTQSYFNILAIFNKLFTKIAVVSCIKHRFFLASLKLSFTL